MCGILGVFLKDSDNMLTKNFQISHALQVLKPRGPDYTKSLCFNNVILAHTRLACVNPSSGAQPLVSEDDNWILSINGEIYNYRDISQVKNSDCDVVLNMLEKGMPICELLPKLEGMFSFVAYNLETDTMYAARDRSGITPLYVAEQDGSYWFSSMLRAFPKGSKPRILMPGTVETLCRNGDNISWSMRVWSKPYIRNVPKTFDRKEYKRLLQSAVESRVTQGDTPWACLLSGGLDSSIVTALACKVRNKNYPTVHTFSIGLPNSPDLKAAEKVAKYLGTTHHSIVVTVEDALHNLENTIRDLETYDVTTIRAGTMNWLLGRELRRHNIKYCLSGEGADESWAGYIFFWKAPSPEALQDECIRKLSRLHAFDCLRSNKALSAHGVECRVPFLSPDVLSYTMNRIHPLHKMSHTHPEGERPEKFELRKMYEHELPESVISRTKEQFSDGVGSLWIESLQEYAEQKIDDELFATRPDHIHTKEAYLYYAIFRDTFYNFDKPEDYVITEPKSIACSTEEALKWYRTFHENADPSGDAVKRALNIE